MKIYDIKTKRLVLTALFAALIFVATAYLPRISIGITGGYAHLGDGFVFIAAAVLPMPYSICAAAIGASFADLFTGYPIWIIATVVIKALSASFFTSKYKKMLCVRNCIAIVLSAVVGAEGYYLYEAAVITGNFVAPLAGIPMNLAQSAVGAVLFLLVGIATDRSKSLNDFLYS